MLSNELMLQQPRAHCTHTYTHTLTDRHSTKKLLLNVFLFFRSDKFSVEYPLRSVHSNVEHFVLCIKRMIHWKFNSACLWNSRWHCKSWTFVRWNDEKKKKKFDFESNLTQRCVCFHHIKIVVHKALHVHSLHQIRLVADLQKQISLMEMCVGPECRVVELTLRVPY